MYRASAGLTGKSASGVTGWDADETLNGPLQGSAGLGLLRKRVLPVLDNHGSRDLDPRAIPFT